MHCRQWASAAATTRRAAAVVADALHRRATMSDRIALALRGWDGHFSMAHALQVGHRRSAVPQERPKPAIPIRLRMSGIAARGAVCRG